MKIPLSIRCFRLFRRRMFVLAVLLPALLGTGCASLQPLSEDAQKTREIMSWINSLSQTYAQKDRSGFFSLFALDDPSAFDVVKSRVEEDFANAASIQMVMNVDRIVYEEGTVSISLFWDGRWEGPKDRTPILRHGDGVLTLSETHPLRIVRTAGHLPWTTVNTR
ncbi:MAG: hypothetical protein HZA19_00150 [Nitrospirae bacterium]|nr:hypothetical protein [Nitrospirota bacterium]